MIKYKFADDSGEDLKQYVMAVCSDVSSILRTRIGRPPALGEKPFLIRKAPDDLPRADISGLPDLYIVNMTCINTRFCLQITYQLAHELGHYYIDPRRSSWFIESTATALSLVALDAMFYRWITVPPFPVCKTEAPSFAVYRREQLSNQLKEIGLEPTETAVSEWLASAAPRMLERSEGNRSQQHACAYIIETVLGMHPKSWGALTFLGAATDPKGVTDFGAWENLCAKKEKPLVLELEKRFAGLMLP
jgi:hypothetical protein